MVGCLEPQRPPSRSSPEVPPVQLPPKLAHKAARALPRSSRVPSNSVRSLSPALQVLQRSILGGGPDAQCVPDAPRGERPREYISALSGAAGFREHAVPSGPPPSPRSDLGQTFGRPSARPDSARPDSARPARPTTPLHVSDWRQDRPQRAPHSARVSRSSVEHSGESLPAVQSARSSRSRPLSAAAQLWTLEEKVDMGEIWKKQMRPERTRPLADTAEGCSLFATALRKEAKKVGTPAVARPKSAFSEDPMDALDGLLASLDEERVMRTEKEKGCTSPKSTPAKELAATRSDSAKEAKCTPCPKIKFGISPMQNGPLLSRTHSPVYDDEFDATSPFPAVDLCEESGDSTAIYCPLSPTIMSVHMPGEVTPQAVAFDDTASSVVFMHEPRKPRRQDGRPCRVRVECRTVADENKHVPAVPQPPCRRHAGTGKLSSRPLGCMVMANFGGA